MSFAATKKGSLLAKSLFNNSSGNVPDKREPLRERFWPKKFEVVAKFHRRKTPCRWAEFNKTAVEQTVR